MLSLYLRPFISRPFISPIFTNELATAETLHEALSQLAADPAVRLPKRDVAAYIKRYEGSK
jgi:hypothetical protein